MSLSMDDKLLGEKVHYYCSSSEDEGEEDDERSGDEAQHQPANTAEVSSPEINDYSGHSTNTGPKGVINDWQRFKQLENEKRTEQEMERMQLAEKLTLTCRSHLDEEKAKAKDEAFMEDIEKELEVFEDEFLKEYRDRRIEEMRLAVENMPRFGGVLPLGKSDFLDAIDNEKSCVTIVIHIYEKSSRACEAMNGCLMCLAKEYPTIKFCKILSSETNLSLKFAAVGVPALLVYKNKDLIGNFIRLSAELGDDFFATDVESFLLEHGMLPDKSLKAAILRTSKVVQSDSDSDFDVD